MTRDAAELLVWLRAEGFRLRHQAGQLLVSPAARLTPSQREALARHRDEVIALLTEAGGDGPFVLPPPQLPERGSRLLTLTPLGWVEEPAPIVGSAGSGRPEAAGGPSAPGPAGISAGMRC